MQNDLLHTEITQSVTETTTAGAADQPIKHSLALKVFGVGGAGCNALADIARAGLEGVEFLAMNTDAAALARCPVANKLSLGAKLTRGLGAGGDPARGRAAAEEDKEKLRALCEGADVLFVVAGLGGGTGTGAAPVLAQIARECGALVLGLVVLPFDWEGARRQRQAERGLAQLQAAADAVVCLPNQKLLTMVTEKTGMVEAFAAVHDLLAQGVRGVCRLLTRPGLMNVDFADVCAVTRDRHSACTLATAEAQGEHRAKELLEKLFNHPLMEEGRQLADSTGVLVSLTGGPDLAICDVRDVMEQIRRQCEHANICMGATIEENLAGRMTVTVLSARRGAHEKAPSSELAVPTESPLPEELEFVDANLDGRPPSRFVAPAQAITPDNAEQIMQYASSRGRKKVQKLRQGTFNLEVINKGRFDKSEPTIRRGQDLDEPTYLRRNLVLN